MKNLVQITERSNNLFEFTEKLKMNYFQKCIISLFRSGESKKENLNKVIYYCNKAKENRVKNNKIALKYKKRHCSSLVNLISLYVKNNNLPIVYKDIIFYIIQNNYEEAIKLINKRIIQYG